MAKEKRDPAFLFYDGDAARDVSHMDRLERGAYFDLIQAQKKFHGYSMEQVRKILGKDFETVWNALDLILEQENGAYYIPWLRTALEERAQKNENQRKRIQEYWDKRKNRGNTMEVPTEDENEDSISNKDIEGINTILSTYTNYTGLKSFLPVYEKMMDVFLLKFSGYFRDEERDFPACQAIASNVEKIKGWNAGDCLNGHLSDLVVFWTEIVDYVAGDKWLRTRSLSDLSTREWQRLGQHMSKPKEEEKIKGKKEDLSDYERNILEQREKAKNKKPE